MMYVVGTNAVLKSGCKGHTIQSAKGHILSLGEVHGILGRSCSFKIRFRMNCMRCIKLYFSAKGSERTERDKAEWYPCFQIVTLY